MKVPIQANIIFDRLSKGQFISEDSSDDEVKELYYAIEQNENYDILYDFFRRIGFYLERGSGYYFFSRKEINQIVEDKIKRAYEWIDIVDFFKTFGKAINEPFSQGVIFTPHIIFEQCKVNSVLNEKLNDLKRYFSDDKPLDRIERIVKSMVSKTFFEVHNEFNDEYKVLASFAYLEQLIMSITILEKEEDEISE